MANSREQELNNPLRTDEVALSIHHNENLLEVEDVDHHNNHVPDDCVRQLTAQINMLKEGYDERIQTLAANIEQFKDLTESLSYYSQRQRSEITRLSENLFRDLYIMQFDLSNLKDTLKSDKDDVSKSLAHLNGLNLQLSDCYERLDTSVTEIRHAFIRSIPFAITTLTLILYIFFGSRV